MAWQIPQDMTEQQLQRARSLLANSEAHAASGDLQRFLDGDEAGERLQSHWLNEVGSPKQGLSRRDKQQGFVLYALYALKCLHGPVSVLPASNCRFAVLIALLRQMVADSQQLCSMNPNSLPYMLHHAYALLAVAEHNEAEQQLSTTLTAARATNSLEPLRCGRCRTTAYCGRRCQVQHFREGHHQECNAIVQRRVQERLAGSSGRGSASGGGSANGGGSS
ncbi:Ubiquitin carboxyl-terminal hydrolase 19 [Chlorella sorokiniana]|uniref:Ubiquitin carboxyl-terminal hydrolase 19 n=1 Tax=Chlorella sorokiniana TaxID=3076 RepID=A0A2P6U267_CHLSO|nr:Ubiquitin carboxyl-terminal hydrolase 19 [Chlorella sorokiniana]|eukprot:PRW60411.1 Ubiquitin carboxyl-terminal hydrolase 19 [Chlorella sorokiniana]